MESEEVQDLITGNINDLNKRVELLSSQHSCTGLLSTPQSVESNEINFESHQDNVNTIASTPQSTTVVNTSVTNAVNEPSNTIIVNESTACSGQKLAVLILLPPVLNSVSPYSISV